MSYSRTRTPYPEARRAADLVVSQVLGVKSGEDVLISSDVDGDSQLADVLFDAVIARDARPALVTTPRLAHPGSPVCDVLQLASAGADVWIELNQAYIEGTRAHIDASKGRLRRFYSLTGMDAGDLVALFDVDLAVLERFGDRLAELTEGSTNLRVTCENGSDFVMSFIGAQVEHDKLLTLIIHGGVDVHDHLV